LPFERKEREGGTETEREILVVEEKQIYFKA